MVNTQTNKLHIVFLDFDDLHSPILSGGQARATYEVGKLLVEKGHQVTVYTSKYPGSKNRTESGIQYIHIGLGSKNIRLNNIAYILSIPFCVSRIRADIIIECFTAPISTLLSPFWTKIPVVGIPTSFEADRFAQLYRLPFDKIEKFGLRFYKYFLPYSKYFQKRVADINPKIISKIVPEGVGKEFFSIPKRNAEHILFLGRFDMGQKGIDILIEAYSKIVDQIAFPLVLAGHGPDEAKIKKLIESKGLEAKVKIIGPTYGEKKDEVLSHSAFVAFPSRHEGFSLFSLEALASALPLVGFDIPGLSWTNDSIALLAKPFDVDEYAKLLKKACDTQVYTTMSENARNFARMYTWDKVADEFESFFIEILKKEGRYEH